MTNIIYYLSGVSCATTCANGWYIPSLNPIPNKCNQCDASCSKCTLNSTNCVVNSCNTGYIYYGINSTCLTSCPGTYYKNSNVCTACDISCKNCTAGTSSSCTSCNSGTYLYGSKCFTSCPQNLGLL